MIPEDQDPVWSLLERASKPSVRPTFAQEVVGAVERLEASKRAKTRRLRWLTLAAAPAAAAAVLLLVFTVHNQDSRVSTDPSVASTSSSIDGSNPTGDLVGPAVGVFESGGSELVDPVEMDLAELGELDEFLALQDVQQLDDAQISRLLF